MTKVCSIVVPVCNEEEGIKAFHTYLMQSIGQIPYNTEIVYVDDGSTDHTNDLLHSIASTSPNVVIITLSRNFGHQAALTAGLNHASGDVVITLDGDGQHPPHFIPQMLTLYENGYDIVYMQRVNKKTTLAKSITANLFYQTINWISETSMLEDVGDFRLMSRQVVNCLNEMPEYHRYLRGLVSWMGFKIVVLPYEMEKRLAGKPKYTFYRLWRLARDGIFSFSTAPLRLAFLASSAMFILMALHLSYVGWIIFTQGRSILPPGWTSLMLGQLLIGGIQLLMLGLQGYYIGMIFQEVKGRPVYIVRELYQSLSKGSVTEQPPLTQER